MINIRDKKDCCGCHACTTVCAKHCITMTADEEGFLYPVVDKEACTDCGLCEKVCPVINQNEPRKPLKVYAAKNKNEKIRIHSSSGGIFTLLAEAIINEGGVIFGAKFDKDWNVVHDYTETLEGIAAFRGSKYVQSTIRDSYREAKNFLKQGRAVLFSGTPCQIAGLKKYLQKDYDNLFTVDIICHGVPSPKVWSMYLKEMSNKLLIVRQNTKKDLLFSYSDADNHCIEAINFRSKVTGWRKYSLLIKLNSPNSNGKDTDVFCERLDKNIYMHAFLTDIILRPACYNCPNKQGKAHSDITIADFWGINNIDPEFADDKGCCAIFINTEKGAHIYPLEQTEYREKTFDEVVKYNSAYYKSSTPHHKRSIFFKNLDRYGVIKSVNKYTKKSLFEKVINRISKMLKKK